MPIVLAHQLDASFASTSTVRLPFLLPPARSTTTRMATAPYSANRGIGPSTASFASDTTSDNASINGIANSLATMVVATRDKLDALLKVQTHPKLDYAAILSDVFASKEDMRVVRDLSPADLRKFFRRCQTVCRDPYIQPHVLTILQHHMISLQAETHTILPLEVTTSELFSLSKAPLAQGGTSLVYRGTWLGGGKVAVKKLRVPWGKDELKDLRKEVGVMRQFDHRHVLPLWGYNLEGWEEEGEEQKRPFLVMPWMENGNACSYLKANPDANRIKIIEEISSAISYLHQAGVVHGDLKGDNIMIDGSSTAFLADFGQCCVLEDVLNLEPAGTTFMGCVRWTAPERLRGGPSTERTDVFAWAMTMLELMTDLPPYAPELHSDVLVNKAIQTGQRPNRPSKKYAVRGLDDKLWSLMERMWVQEGKRRLKSMEVREEMRVIRANFQKASSASRLADVNMMNRTGGPARSLVPAPRSSKTSSRNSSGLISRGSAHTTSSTSSIDGSFPQTPSPRYGTTSVGSEGGKKKSVFAMGRGR